MYDAINDRLQELWSETDWNVNYDKKGKYIRHPLHGLDHLYAPNNFILTRIVYVLTGWLLLSEGPV